MSMDGNKSAAIVGEVSADVLVFAVIGAISVWKERRAVNTSLPKTNVRIHKAVMCTE